MPGGPAGAGSDIAIGGPPTGEYGLGQDQVQRPGHLERFLVAGHDHDRRPEPLDQPGVVGGALALDDRVMRLEQGRAGRSPAGSVRRAAGPARGCRPPARACPAAAGRPA